MSTKLVTVLGATGAQGGSVVDSLLKDKSYKVRAVTRRTTSEAAKALAARGVEVVQADVSNQDSLEAAFKDSYAIYAVTDFWEPFAQGGPAKAMEIEVAQGYNVARAASATPTLQHFIWSTLPDSKAISGGKIVVPHFEAKNDIDRFIAADKKLYAKTTYFWVGYYASNFQFPMFTPSLVPTAGKYIQIGNYAADTPVTLIGDPRVNVGPVVAAILAQPDKTRHGAQVHAYAESTTAAGLLQIWAEATGNKAAYVRTDRETFHNMWPMWAEEMGIMMEFWDLARERSWERDGGKTKVITAKDLGVELMPNSAEVCKTLKI